MKSKKLVIFGAGEIGQLARFYFSKDSIYQVVAFTADDEFVNADTFEGIALVPFSKIGEFFPSKEVEMYVALSYKKLNRIRCQKYEEAKKRGYKLASYICSKSVYWDDLYTGDNCFILENQTIQPTVKIGNNVMIWSGNHIGHGAIIEDHCYISSHVVISGHVVVGEGSFLGINSAIKDFVTIGPETFITMNAVVTKNVEAGSVVVASPSTVYNADSRESKALKQKYFSLE